MPRPLHSRRNLVSRTLLALAGVGLLRPQKTAPQERNTPSPPGPPATGPGSEEPRFPTVRTERYGTEPGGYWIFEPVVNSEAEPSEPLPVVLYISGCCGNGAYPIPEEVTPWLEYTASQGYVVIAPVYNVAAVLTETPAFFTEALAELEQPGHAPVDSEQFAIFGYSFGGTPALHWASTAAEAELPVPQALFLVAPCEASLTGGFCVAIPQDPVFPSEMKAIVLAFDQDLLVQSPMPELVYEPLRSLPSDQRDFIILKGDDHGDPPITTPHETPHNDLDAADWWGIWKLSTALLSCTFADTFCDVALGNTPRQRSMGKWSDGVPVTEMDVESDEFA